MEALVQDLRYVLRLLRKAPGFTIAAVITLALGMGANTAMFSVLNTVLIRPLPYPQPDRLVQIWETDSRRGETAGVVSAYDFVDWQNQSRNFESMATYDYNSTVLSGQRSPVRLSTIFVSAHFFDVFKVTALKGRTFLSDEDQPGKPRAAVLSYGAWQRQFGADPGIVGHTIILDDQAYSVVGVMPADFAFPHSAVDVWCVPGFDLKLLTRNHHGLEAIGRIRPGVDFEKAQAEMSTIAERLSETYNQPGRGVRLVELHDEIVGKSKHSLLVLWAAVLAVLLIACANVAGLLLARAVSRQKEVAIRAALGGSRTRLLRQFLTESVVLALLGGILGIALSYSAGRFLVSASHGAVPRLRDLHIDGWVLAFTGLACLVTGVAFGLAPAVIGLRVNLNAALKVTGAAAHFPGRLRLRSLLVVAELALAMVLLTAGGLLMETLWRLQHVDAGFSPENVITFRFAVAPAKYPTSAERGDLYERVAERLATIPGVDSAGAINDLPFAGSRSQSSFDIEGRAPDPAVLLEADYRNVSPDYFRAMRIRLLEGREFSLHDNRNAPFVAVVNHTFATRFFAGEDPVGHRIRSHHGVYEIVGVVGDVKHQNLAEPSPPELYLSCLQADLQPWMFFTVRSRIETTALSASIRDAVKEVAPGEPIYRIAKMSGLLENSISPQKFSGLLLGIFAGLALVLAGIGVYGVIAYSVAQRTREIGVRMALGANSRNVLILILRQAAAIGIAGLAVGSAAAYAGTRMLASMLFGVKPHDPAIFFAVAASILALVLMASYVPARRAALVDPLAALRHE